MNKQYKFVIFESNTNFPDILINVPYFLYDGGKRNEHFITTSNYKYNKYERYWYFQGNSDILDNTIKHKYIIK